MFMIEKSLIIVIFMYSSSFGILGAQYIYGDVFGVTLTNFQGVPLKNNLLQDINQNTFNKLTNSTLSLGNQTNTFNTFTNSVGIAGSLAWDLILLMSGTYIFNVLLQLGIPLIFLGWFVGLYLILLARTIAGYIRGI